MPVGTSTPLAVAGIGGGARRGGRSPSSMISDLGEYDKDSFVVVHNKQ